MFFKGIGFRISLIIFVIMLVVTSIGISLNIRNIISETTGEVQGLVMSRANQTAEQVDKRVNIRLSFFETASEYLSGIDFNDSAALSWELERYCSFVDYFDFGMTVIRPDGRGLLAEYPVIENRTALDYSNSEWFINALDKNETVLSAPFIGRASGEAIIVIAQALYDENNNIAGVLVAPLALSSKEFIGDIYSMSEKHHNDTLIISRPDKVFIIPPETVEVLSAVSAPGINLLHDKAMSGFEGVGITVNAFEEEEIAAMATVEILDWFVVARMPTNVAYRLFYKQLRSFAVTEIIILVTTIIFVLIALKIFFHPLSLTSRAVRMMADGNRKLEVLPLKRRDEIGNLIAGFNHLVKTVNKRTEELEVLSQIDGLTNLYNIRYMNELMEKKWREYARRKQFASIIMIDIDFFKKYNDNYGHPRGDICLTEIAKALNSTLKRPADLLGRYGGEEFIAFVEGSSQETEEIAEMLRVAVSSLGIEHASAPEGIVTISLGVAGILPDNKSVIQDLIKVADIALYRSKESGRNCVTI